MKPAAVRVRRRRDSLDEALAALARARRRGEGARGRAEPRAAAEHAPRPPVASSSTSTACRPRRDRARERRACGSARSSPGGDRARLTRLAARWPSACRYVGHFVTRNRGTVGGSIAHADAARRAPARAHRARRLVVVAAEAAARRSRPRSSSSRTYDALDAGELLVETRLAVAPTGLRLRVRGVRAASRRLRALHRPPSSPAVGRAARRRPRRASARLSTGRLLVEVGVDGRGRRRRRWRGGRARRRGGRRAVGTLHASPATCGS